MSRLGVFRRSPDGGAGEPGRDAVLRRLLPYGLEVRYLLTGLFVCIICGSLLELAIPAVMGFLLFDRVIGRADVSQLPVVIAALTGIFVAQKVFAFFQEYLHELASQRLVFRVRCDFYERLQALPLRFFDQRRTGELLARTTGDVDTVEGLLRTVVQDVGTELVMFVGTVYFLYTVNPALTLYVLPTILGLVVSVALFKRTAKRFARRARALLGEIAALASETLAGVRIVKAYGAEAFEHARFAAKARELMQARVSTAKLQSVYSSSVDLWVFAGTIIVLLIATPRVVAGSITVGALVAYLGYLAKLYGPAKKLSKVNFSIQKILASAERIFEVMDLPVEASGPPPALPVVQDAGRRPTAVTLRLSPRPDQAPRTPLRGAVRFDRVTFAYDDNPPALRNFSLDVRPGEIIALAGRSGAGKTTVANLLLRFYEPGAGRILLDGEPIDQIPLRELRRQIGLVQQDIFLFSGSVRDNIAYAQPSASDEVVREAARLANAHEFIVELPRGYATDVGERGVKLSGGQRQRLAIARALIRNPQILIFDEATSHLDSESERLVQDALERVSKGRTVFIIAHRVSSVARADRTVVIDRGVAIAVGRHEELLVSSALYRKLYPPLTGRAVDLSDAVRP
jgi:subfamily B ATP-binding cassette protein MsbA